MNGGVVGGGACFSIPKLGASRKDRGSVMAAADGGGARTSSWWWGSRKRRRRRRSRDRRPRLQQKAIL
ncbi:UNVERIFIED_CONTAM: hypothetical protein Slati_0584700 [Sesamum latifolium]|uniref:Uncharacterized protein n=1 Tax=Sesamum latifolium TaxID=2727402 RepID=A0AAW2Y1G6_9LAMI